MDPHRHARPTGAKLAAALAVLAGTGIFASVGVFSAYSDTKANSASMKLARFGLTQTPSSFLTNLTDLVPGDSITRCIEVLNDSEVTAQVTAVPAFDSGALNSVIKVSVENGTGAATDGGCGSWSGAGTYAMGTSAAGVLPSAMTASAQTSWSAGEQHEYRITIAVPSSATTADANKAGVVGFNWTGVQNTGAAR